LFFSTGCALISQVSAGKPDGVSGGGNVDESRRFENPVRLTVKN
jgi:hypothetical protein